MISTLLVKNEQNKIAQPFPLSYNWNLESPLGKYLYFVDWAKYSLSFEKGYYTRSADLYKQYVKSSVPCFANIPKECQGVMSKTEFFKEIGPLMSALYLYPIQDRSSAGRGYIGLKCLP